MSLPEPEPGLVLSYSFLWRTEQEIGLSEGRKDRPAVIILRSQRIEGRTVVTVLPITHSPPAVPQHGVEVPMRIKANLNLDGDRSWLVLNEANMFVWPGHDIRRRRVSGKVEYGHLPPRFFMQIRDAFVALYRARTANIVRRD